MASCACLSRVFSTAAVSSCRPIALKSVQHTGPSNNRGGRHMTTTVALDFTERRVRIDVEDVWLRPGLGGQELRFDLRTQAPWLADDSPDSYEALSLQVRIEAGRAYSFRPLGHGVLTCLIHKFPAGEQLWVLISDEQLLALEAIGDQGGIEFQLDITATLSNQSQGRPDWTSTQARHVVSSGRWAELLDQAGAATTITVRVPSPFTSAATDGSAARTDNRSATQAARRLRDARQLLLDGNFDECVRVCRLVLDNVKALSERESTGAAGAAKAQKRSQSQRWDVLLQDLYSLASGAHHDDEVTREFTWSRTDAQAALAMTAALLSRVP